MAKLTGTQMQADEINRLTAVNARLREALRPFAANVDSLSLSGALGHIQREDLHRAREALTHQTK